MIRLSDRMELFSKLTIQNNIFFGAKTPTGSRLPYGRELATFGEDGRAEEDGH